MKKKGLIICIIALALIAAISSSFAASITCPYCDRGAIIRETGTYTDGEWNNGPHGSCTKNYGHTYYWDVDYTHIYCDSCDYDSVRTRDYGWRCP